MKIGDLVWNCHNSSVRFGTIKNKRKEKKWAYFTVSWHADEAHKQDIKWRKKLSGIDLDLKEYRGDTLRSIESDRLIRVLEEHAGEREENNK